jgi:hypothetical protein
MFYRARFYDPQIGRFISEDPIGFAGKDINLYAYVKNNPLRFNDPLGLVSFAQKCFLTGFAVGAIGGGLAGGTIGAGVGTLGIVGGPLVFVTVPTFSLAGASIGAGVGGITVGAISGLVCMAMDDAEDKPCEKTKTPDNVIPFPSPRPRPSPTPTPAPTPPPPNRESVCKIALMACHLWAGDDIEKAMLCNKSYTECKKTNLPVTFPNRRWVPPLP